MTFFNFLIVSSVIWNNISWKYGFIYYCGQIEIVIQKSINSMIISFKNIDNSRWFIYFIKVPSLKCGLFWDSYGQ